MLSGSPSAFDVDVTTTAAQPDSWWEQWAVDAARATVKVVVFAVTVDGLAAMVVAHTEAGVVCCGALWVDPGCRRRGIADTLLDAVETWAHDVRAATVELGVAADNVPALDLYRRGITKRPADRR